MELLFDLVDLVAQVQRLHWVVQMSLEESLYFGMLVELLVVMEEEEHRDAGVPFFVVEMVLVAQDHMVLVHQLVMFDLLGS